MKESKREGGTGSSFTHRHEQEVEHGVAFECLHNSSITQWCRQSSEKQHTWQYCVCSVVRSTVQVLAEDFCNQFRDFSSLYGPVYTSLLIFTNILQVCNFTVKIKRMMQLGLHVISPMSLQHNTSYTMFH